MSLKLTLGALLSLALLSSSALPCSVSASSSIQADASAPCPFSHLHRLKSIISSAEMAAILASDSIPAASAATAGPFRAPADDESGSAADKAAAVWQLVTANTASAGKYSSLGMLWESMTPTVSSVSDVIPAARAKDVHSIGSVALATLSFTADIAAKYSGLFRSGSQHVVLRLSSAADPGNKAPISSIGVKAMRSGVHSGNTFFLATNPSTWNFFTTSHQTHIFGANATFATRLVQAHFASVTSYPAYTGLADFASWDEAGQQVSQGEVSFPFQLAAVPNAQLAARQLQPDGNPFTDQFADIPAGTEVYQIYVQDEPFSAPVLGGSLTLTTPLSTSTYGDTQLFYRHEIWDNDLQIRPDWKQQCPGAYDCDYLFVAPTQKTVATL